MSKLDLSKKPKRLKLLFRRWFSYQPGQIDFPKRVMSFLPDRTYLAIRYRRNFGRWPSFNAPRTFNEHILSLMLSDRDRALRSMISDKVAVRDHVESLGCGDHLAEIHAVVTANNPLQFDDLPNQFVMKASHGSGLVKIVTDKAGIDRNALQQLSQSWFAHDFSKVAREFVYSELPRRVIIEELLSDPKTGAVPVDYKLFVFDGIVRFIQVDSDRFGSHKRSLYDPAWRRIPVAYKHQEGPDVEKPVNLKKMLELAGRLAQGLRFIRVDLYDLTDRVVFGELTNFPEAGNGKFEPTKFDAEFGQFFDGKAAVSPNQEN